MFGPKREEVAGGWRRLHNEELHNLYAALNIVRGDQVKEDEMGGHVARVGEMRNSYNILIEKLLGNRTLERSRRRWEDNIEMGLLQRYVGGV
jgi:hypothetical protein